MIGTGLIMRTPPDSRLRPSLVAFVVALASACTPTSPQAKPGSDTDKPATPEKRGVRTAASAQGHLRDVVQVDSLGNASCALTSVGAVYCWGELRAAAQPQDTPLFGRGTGVPILVPAPDDAGRGAVDRILILGTAIAARRTDGELWIAGELPPALGTASQRFQSTGVADVEHILRGTDPLCWLSTRDAVRCWSLGEEKPSESRSLPAGVLVDESTTSCFGTADGVRCLDTGLGLYGLDAGKPCPDTLTPLQWLPLPAPPVRIVESRGRVCALTETRSGHCIDRRESVEMAGDTIVERLPPTAVTYDGPFVDVALEANSGVCFATPEGSVQCQGRSILGATDIVQLSAGSAHVCGLRSDGRVMCSGTNEGGQRGNGTVDDRLSAGPPSRMTTFVVAPAQGQPRATHGLARRRSAAQWRSGAPLPCDPG